MPATPVPPLPRSSKVSPDSPDIFRTRRVGRPGPGANPRKYRQAFAKSFYIVRYPRSKRPHQRASLRACRGCLKRGAGRKWTHTYFRHTRVPCRARRTPRGFWTKLASWHAWHRHIPVNLLTQGPVTRLSQFQQLRMTPEARCHGGAFTPSTGIEGCGRRAARAGLRVFRVLILVILSSTSVMNN
jgi:hypothetical protein